MLTLSVKTRGNANPQGKQRVYFCCQEDDFEKYFEPVSNEILEKQNCAVYYLEPTSDDVDLEELFLHLSQMQLFVMPVTTKLLTTKNRAIDIEFPFAIEKHIPVLPLMQEGGLEDVFNKKCGDLQFLDKTSRDATAISYEEKLGKFLSSVLVGDELAKKVRDAFDAYVFLSYRKKDRKYAQELMRLIHENDFCRDIAIWYDEFLTPGENFNDLIRQALEKSELFALAVTPNLVNEENYVKNIEYPMAVKEGKKVLPAELVPTDSEELKSQYPGISDSTNAHDKEALSKALFASFEEIAKKENDNDPEHNFFIGLAYLNGIDVEVNHERAVTLITQAAENGVTEAIEKLVSMYRNAEGVKRNYETAIKWQEKLVEQREKRYNETGEAEDCYYYIDELWDLGNYWKELGKVFNVKNVYQRMLEASEEAFERFKTFRCNRYISVSYNKLGDSCRAEGKLQAAREYYEKAFEIDKCIAEETETVEARSDLSVSYDMLGGIYEAEGKLQAAREYYEKGLEIRKSIAEETETVEARRDLSISYDRLGNICKAEGKLQAAREHYEKAFEIDKRIAEETETVEARRDLSISYERLGDICKAEGKVQAAKEYYGKKFEIDERIAEETETVEARRNLSISYERLGGVFEAEGDLQAAREYYEKGLEIRKRIAEETETVEAKRDLSVSYNKLGDICRAEGNLQAAREYYEKGLEISKGIAEETDSSEVKRELSIIYSNLGDVDKAERNVESAKKNYENCVDVCKLIAEETRNNEDYNLLAVSYYKVACLLKKDDAKVYYKKAYEIWSTLSEKCPDNSEYAHRRDAVKKYVFEEVAAVDPRKGFLDKFRKLGDAFKAFGELKSAQEHYEKAIEIAKQIAEETGMAQDYDTLALLYYTVAGVTEENGAFLNNAYKIWSALAEKYPDNSRYAECRDIVKNNMQKESNSSDSDRSLLAEYVLCGDKCKENGDLKSAKGYYIMAFEIISRIAQKTNTVGDRSALSAISDKLGDICKSEKDYSTAFDYYKKSLEINKQIAKETGTVEAYDDLAFSYYRMARILAKDSAKAYYKIAYDIWSNLAEQCPDNPRFAKCRDTVKEYL